MSHGPVDVPILMHVLEALIELSGSKKKKEQKLGDKCEGGPEDRCKEEVEKDVVKIYCILHIIFKE